MRCAEECARGETLYEVLGIAEGVSDVAIKRAFRQLSLRLHPDKQRGGGAAGAAAAAARFAEVRMAFDLLADASGALYDMHGMESVDDGQERQRGDDFAMELSVTLVELYTGTTKSTIKRRAVCGVQARARTRHAALPTLRRLSERLKRVNVQIAPGLSCSSTRRRSRKSARTAPRRSTPRSAPA